MMFTVNESNQVTVVFPETRRFFPWWERLSGFNLGLRRVAAGVSIETRRKEGGKTNPHLIPWEALTGLNVDPLALSSASWRGRLGLPDGWEIEVTWRESKWNAIKALHPALGRAKALMSRSDRWGWDDPEFISVCQELGLAAHPPTN